MATAYQPKAHDATDNGLRSRRFRNDGSMVGTYGFDPYNFGLDFFIMRDGIHKEGLPSSIKDGDLVVVQPANKPIKRSAMQQPNFLRARTYGDTTYYVFEPLEQNQSIHFAEGRDKLQIVVGRPTILEIRNEEGTLVITASNPETGDIVERYML
jgi:hypothetical protein